MFTPAKPWKLFAIGYLIISFIVVVCFSLTFGFWGSLISSAFCLFVLIGILTYSWNTIPHMHQWIVEFMGKYTGSPLKPGLHFIFPLFTVLRSDTLMSEQLMELYLDENKDDKLGGGVVDFEDASAPVEAKAFIQILRSEDATYKISDVFKAIEERLDSALRAFLANYTIEKAGSLKTYFKLGVILNGLSVEKTENHPICYKDEFGEEVSLESDQTTIKYSDGTTKKPKVLEEIEEWGATVKTIVITDIVLSNEIREARREVLKAEQNEKAALHNKKATITKSEGDMEAEANRGRGEAKRFAFRGTGMKNQIKKIAKSGLSVEDASKHITKIKLYENIGDKAVVLESLNPSVGQGAHIGAGAAVVSSAVSTPKTPSSTPTS